MKKLLITGWVPEQFLEKYRTCFEITIPSKEKEYFTREEVSEMLPAYDALFTIMAFSLKGDLFDHADRLKVVANYGVGYDNIDVAECTRRNIVLINTPTTVTEPTAELTIAIMMAITKGIVMYDRDLRQTCKMNVSLFFDRDMLLMGKTLGVLGFGRIGQAVARKARGLGMKIMYYDPYRKTPEEEQRLEARYATFEEVLRSADVICCHMPYTEQNHHLIDMRAFKMMKNTAYFINTARGPIMCEADLAAALKTGEIRGAAIDVYEHEPNVPPEIAQIENIVITPHIGSNVMEARKAMVEEALDGVFAVLSGNSCHNIVNPEALGTQNK